MIIIERDTVNLITDELEALVAALSRDFAREGKLVSGETIYKIINAYSATKEEEFKGTFN